jgi:hypothetical protein
MATRSGTPWRPEMTGQMLQCYLWADAKVSISRRIMSRDRLPEKAICRTWLGYPQPIYLDVCEWVCLLFEAGIRSILVTNERPYVLFGHVFQLSHHSVHGGRFSRPWDPGDVCRSQVTI